MPVRVLPTTTPAVATPASPVAAPTSTGTTTTASDPVPTPNTPAPSSFDGSSGGPADVPGNALPVPDGAVNLFASRLAAMGGTDAMMMALSTDAGRRKMAAELEALVSGDPASAAVAERVEKQVIGMIAQANAAGQLPEILGMIAEQVGGPMDGMPAEQKQMLIAQLAGMIDAELSARGMTPGSTGVVYKSWDELSAEHLAAVRDTSVPAAGPGHPSAFTKKAFLKEMEELSGAKFSSRNRVTPLINGPASFAARKELIEGATESINMMSWAFYDDETGWETARMLAAKAEGDPPVTVKIIVDGQVAARPHHHETLEFMEQHGVEVVRWHDPERKYDGQHRKCMVVDGKAAISGGMNVGDVYSHGGPADEKKWRDTDMQIEGKAVGEAQALFVSIWNQQCEQHGLPHAPIGDDVVAQARERGAQVRSTAKVGVVNHVPGPDGDAHILLATLKAIEGATESVAIENAYFIQTPALRDALLAALDRGVKVQLLTNSAESVDEPVVTVPILESLPELVEKGAEVYLKQGDTLHSKFMVVDGRFSMVGSYNLHPRSHRYEGELMMNVVDKRFGKKMAKAFAKDIAAARKLDNAADLEIPSTALSTLASRYFFDQL